MQDAANGIRTTPAAAAARVEARARLPPGDAERFSGYGVIGLSFSYLGPPGPLAGQARLGDFWMPQRGLFAVGQAHFERLDPVRHAPAAPALAGAAGRAP